MPCLVCRSPKLETRFDLGPHPVSSFFLETADGPETSYPIALGQCPDCGTIQLMQPVPADSLVPPSLFKANEPEEHLDDTVARILAIPGVNRNQTVGALTFKDDTTVQRFERQGFTSTWRIDPVTDLGMTDPNMAIETIQKLTTPARMADIASRRGAADILIVRHILEHAEDLQAFIGGLSALVKPGGLIMVEVPDCTNSLTNADFAMIWEEHSLYLTPETFEPLLTLGGFETVWSTVYPLPFENSMVQVARKTGAPGALKVSPEALATVGLLDRYAARFGKKTEALRAHLGALREGGNKVALFGAGHLACHFLNFHGLADLVTLVLDDTPGKQNRYLPGARLPILPTPRLAEGDIQTCLLAISIQNEDRVLSNNATLAAFAKGGGRVRSIFAASPRSIHADAGV